MPLISLRFHSQCGEKNPRPPWVFKELFGQMFPLVTLVQIQGNPTKAGGCPSFPLGTDAWVWPMEVAYMSVTSPQLVLLYTGGDWEKKLAQLLLRKHSGHFSKCYFKYRGFSFNICYSELKSGWSFLATSKCCFGVCFLSSLFLLYPKPSISTFPTKFLDLTGAKPVLSC